MNIDALAPAAALATSTAQRSSVSKTTLSPFLFPTQMRPRMVEAAATPRPMAADSLRFITTPSSPETLSLLHHLIPSPSHPLSLSSHPLHFTPSNSLPLPPLASPLSLSPQPTQPPLWYPFVLVESTRADSHAGAREGMSAEFRVTGSGFEVDSFASGGEVVLVRGAVSVFAGVAGAVLSARAAPAGPEVTLRWRARRRRTMRGTGTDRGCGLQAEGRGALLSATGFGSGSPGVGAEGPWRPYSLPGAPERSDRCVGTDRTDFGDSRAPSVSPSGTLRAPRGETFTDVHRAMPRALSRTRGERALARRATYFWYSNPLDTDVVSVRPDQIGPCGTRRWCVGSVAAHSRRALSTHNDRWSEFSGIIDKVPSFNRQRPNPSPSLVMPRKGLKREASSRQGRCHVALPLSPPPGHSPEDQSTN